ncbi:MAG: putative baseplate assembly protein, partial [Myxococcaceae bacterium]|nr:putative baseplate assembly protein [Myxococcaceae bacterium]
GQVVEVLEPAPLVPTPAPGGAPLAPPTGATAWVEWTEVGSFAFSGPQDRHYVLDHTHGTLTFGDGVRGMAPPRGENNVRARRYRSGGGTLGNVAADTLTQLQRARPGLASVNNVVPAQGGADGDTLDVLRALGPLQMKAQNRAVSAEDFATLARTSSPRVAQATAQADLSGSLVVTLLPNEEGLRPTVTSTLVDEVRAALAAKMLPLVSAHLVVQGPCYRPIDVTVNAVLERSARVAQVRDQMEDRLAAYFAPLPGPLSPGWSFGAVISAAELATVLAQVDGVAAIDGVALAGDLPTLTLEGPELPCAGALTLEVTRAG